MSHSESALDHKPKNAYQRIPLYLKILIALILGAAFGSLGKAAGLDPTKIKWISDLVLRMLRLLATPLIFSAVLGSIVTANLSGKKAGRLMVLLMTNSIIAILIGLLVANAMQPGQHFQLTQDAKLDDKQAYNIWTHLFESIPTDFVTPFVKNDVISVIILAIAIGMAMRLLLHSQNEQLVRSVKSLQNVLNAIFQLMVTILKWVFELVPFAVFAVVSSIVAEKGLGSLLAMGYWVICVLVALVLMLGVYLVRLYLQAKISPIAFLRGGGDAFIMAFSTASSAATLPVTYRCATEKLNVHEDNANLGIMVGGTFNHDGTALYEAMAALLVAQGIGMSLPTGQQAIVVVMAIVASVGAAGIPEAGLVTMIAVFKAVNLPIHFIPFLLTVDWFLDRCRTTVNVMGDMASTCILNAKE